MKNQYLVNGWCSHNHFFQGAYYYLFYNLMFVPSIRIVKRSVSSDRKIKERLRLDKP